MPDTILAIDPSSTCVGWALFRGRDLAECGRITPRRTRDDHLVRIPALVLSVGELVERTQPATIVVEVPSGKPGRGSRAGATGHLAIYGMAAGAVWVDLHISASSWVDGGCEVHPVEECAWTRGKRKEARARLVRMAHPDVDWSEDAGLDIADAVGLGEWWMAERLVRA